VDQGYFKIYRKIYDSEIWTSDPSLLKLFFYLIGKARHKIKPKKYPNFEVKRGELVTSLRNIADDNHYLKNNKLIKWSPEKVRRMLKTLELLKMIEIPCDTFGTHIKVCNYNTYNPAQDIACDSSVTASDRGVTAVRLNNNDKNVNNDNNNTPPISPKPTRKKKTQKQVENPPTLKEWQDYAYKYACGYYNFSIYRLKLDCHLHNDWDYWEGRKWKGRENWQRMAQNCVRRLNIKIKDYTRESDNNVIEF